MYLFKRFVLFVNVLMMAASSQSSEDSDRIIIDGQDNGNSDKIGKKGNTTSVKNLVFKNFEKPPDKKAQDYISKKKYRPKIMTTCPLKGKGGESFLYKNESKESQVKICDLYSWIRADTWTNQDGMTKLRYYIRKPIPGKIKDSRFCRIVYYDTKLEPKDRVYLIVYIGDEKVHVPLKNTKTGKNLKKTQPKIIEEIKARSGEKPQKLYSDLLSKSNKELIDKNLITSYLHRDTYSPRDIKQVKQIQYLERKKEKISKDFIYNAYEIGLHLEDYILKFELLPELLIIFGHKQMLELTSKVLRFSDKQKDPELLFGYDTTFQMGNFFISTLTMKNVFLENGPIFPVIFMLHMTKRSVVHNTFFHQVKTIFEKDHFEKFPIVTDREKGITSAIKENGMKLVLCTNHIKRDVKLWLKKNANNFKDKKEQENFKNQIDELLKAESFKYFEYLKEQFVESCVNNDRALKYARKIIEDIERFCLYSDYKGYSAFKGNLATSNMCEAFNYIMKSMTDWKKMNVDTILLALSHLQNYFLNEFERAKRDMGKFKKNQNYPENIEIQVKEFVPLEDIIHHIKLEITEPTLNIRDKDRETNIYFANMAVKRGAVNVGRGFFTVQSYSNEDKIYIVKLFPKKSCSCKQKSRCYHIMAVEMQIGLHDPESTTELNISDIVSLKENKHGKSGQKHFRKVDKDKFTKPKDTENEQAKLVPLKLELTDSSDSSVYEDTEPENTEEIEQVYLTEKQLGQLLVTDDNYIFCPKLVKKFTQNEWSKLKISELRTMKFEGIFKSLEPRAYLTTDIIDRSIQALISKFKCEDLFGYMSSYSIECVLKNLTELIQRNTFHQGLLNKQTIFVLVYSDHVEYPVKKHWIMGIIDLKNKVISITDSLMNRRKISDYSITFYALFKLIQVLYSAEPVVTFNQSDWDLKIFEDSGQQNDSDSCGLYVIACVYAFLTQTHLGEIDDTIRMRYWVRNLIQQFYKDKDTFNYSIGTLNKIHFDELIKCEVKIERSDPYLVNLLHVISQGYIGEKCDQDGCEGFSHKAKKLCVSCRKFYHLDHLLFDEKKSIIFYVCLRCSIEYDL